MRRRSISSRDPGDGFPQNRWPLTEALRLSLSAEGTAQAEKDGQSCGGCASKNSQESILNEFHIGENELTSEYF